MSNQKDIYHFWYIFKYNQDMFRRSIVWTADHENIFFYRYKCLFLHYKVYVHFIIIYRDNDYYDVQVAFHDNLKITNDSMFPNYDMRISL